MRGQEAFSWADSKPIQLSSQVIKSGDEEVEYCMSEPKRMNFDLSLLYASIEQDTEDQEDQEDED